MKDFELDTLISTEEKQFLEQYLICSVTENCTDGAVRYAVRFKHQLVAETAALLISQFRSERLAVHRDARH